MIAVILEKYGYLRLVLANELIQINSNEICEYFLFV